MSGAPKRSTTSSHPTKAVRFFRLTALFHALALATLVWMRTVGGYERIETLPLTFAYVLVALVLGFVGLRGLRAAAAWVGVVHVAFVVAALVVLMA